MLKLPCVTILLTFYIYMVAAGNIVGYHYEKPSSTLSLVEGHVNLAHGHNFAALPTIQPLPPVPNLPALPTGRSKNQFIQTRTIYQTHPVGSVIGSIAQQYQPRNLVAQQSTTSSIRSPSSLGVGSNIPNPPPPPVQPLRVPFGKKAVITIPTASANDIGIYTNGRQLHQYAVIEIIDNDIEQSTQPFLNAPFFENYRAHDRVGSRAGAPPPLGSRLLGGRSSAAFLGQQPVTGPDAVALGSGGLGFIRLANGNVYLGSGSLGYVSSQQHTHDVNEARTRTGATQPDALHFGHGPLGTPRLNRFF